MQSVVAESPARPPVQLDDAGFADVVPAPRRPQAALRVALFIALLLASIVAGDAAARALAERRAAQQFSAALATDVAVSVDGWPFLVRAAGGDLPEVHVSSTGNAPFALNLFDVGLAATAGRPLITAQRALLDLDAPAVLGVPRLRLQLRDVSISSERRGTRIEAASAQIRDVGSSVAPALTGVARGVRLELPGQASDRSARLSAAHLEASSTASRDAAPLQLGARSVVLDARKPAVIWNGSSATVRADHATLDARDLPLTGANAVLERLAVVLPDATMHATAGSLAVRSDRGTFQARLDEAAANRLWPHAGDISFTGDAARLALGPLELAVTLQARDGALLLRPQLPSLLRSQFGGLVELSVRPELPAGTSLREVQVRRDVLVLRGAAERMALPR